jgi:hypothetical protein
MQSAMRHGGIKGLILRVNSPGGSPVQAGQVYDEVRRLRALHPDVPIYAVVEEAAASGGYYIAAAADRIYVDKASIVGSIGVVMDGFGFTGAMEKLGVERVDRIRLAGAFGAHIDVRYAMILGMIPDCPLERVSSAGNAAGTGARIALLDSESRALIQRRVTEVEKIETAIEERFQHHFVAALKIPHETDPFDDLRQAVALPEDDADTDGRRSRRHVRPSMTRPT